MTQHSGEIRLSAISKKFGSFVVLDNFSLSFKRGEISAIFGPNGCGKSTLLGILADVIAPDSGTFDGHARSGDHLQTSIVFQNFRDALFPWLSCLENIEYPLLARGVDAQARHERVQELVAQCGVRFDLKKYPYQLSGGQQQLVALMRALAPRPQVLLLDEPFSALDYEWTLFMRDKIQELHAKEGLTIVVVTHSIEEAILLADRIVLLSKVPARVLLDEHIPLSRPRGVEAIGDSRFLALQRDCLRLFRAQVQGVPLHETQ